MKTCTKEQITYDSVNNFSNIRLWLRSLPEFETNFGSQKLHPEIKAGIPQGCGTGIVLFSTVKTLLLFWFHDDFGSTPPTLGPKVGAPSTVHQEVGSSGHNFSYF